MNSRTLYRRAPRRGCVPPGAAHGPPVVGGHAGQPGDDEPPVSQQRRLSEWTVVNHVRQVMRRLDVPSRIHVAQWVMDRQRRNGLGTAAE
ncbi:LuxR C-terminal-related transcriptional regulator [Streptomyces coeruleorubidus]